MPIKSPIAKIETLHTDGVPDLIVRSNSEDDGGPDKRFPPTLEAAAEFQYGYGYFNDALFSGRLPDCQITYTRAKNVLGHFYPNRFERTNGVICHEIAINPTYAASEEDRETLATLVHEMAHLWRHEFGPLNRRGGRGTNGYHDLVWAEAMERIGLMPSDTGLPGGKKTGNRMSHYIVDGGLFDPLCRKLLESGFRLNWHDRIVPVCVNPGGEPDEAPEPAKKDRIKFTCPVCALNAWAKPSAHLKCGNCGVTMLAAGRGLPVPVVGKPEGAF